MWALKILDILVKRRRFIIVNTLVVTILAAIISLIIPKTYRAKATILPPESESPLSSLAGLSAGHIAMAVTNFALPLMATPSDLYASMLGSETILRRVVDSLDLKSIYHSQSSWDAVGELKQHVMVRVEREGIISVEADAKDRQLAADIANILVATLDDFNRRLQNQKGREYSNFLERRLAETDSALRVSENELKNFQQSHRAVSLDRQSEALIENLASQKALLTGTEIELEILKKSLYPNHPELVKKQMAVNEIRKKLTEIENGATTRLDSTLSVLDIPLSSIPDLTLQFSVLKRNAKIQELTYELLSQQLEMSRIQERRDTPTVMILDSARPPDMPIKPRKKMIVIAAFSLTAIISVTIAVGVTRIEEKRGAGKAVVDRLVEVYRELKKRPFG